MGRKKVVTWGSPRGNRTRICQDCEARFRAAGEWPKDQYGEEYCKIYMGLTPGVCHYCEPEVVEA